MTASLFDEPFLTRGEPNRLFQQVFDGNIWYESRDPATMQVMLAETYRFIAGPIVGPCGSCAYCRVGGGSGRLSPQQATQTAVARRNALRTRSRNFLAANAASAPAASRPSSTTIHDVLEDSVGAVRCRQWRRTGRHDSNNRVLGSQDTRAAVERALVK